MSSPFLKAVVAKATSTDGITVKDRRYRLKVYKSCFIAKEFVTWIATEYLAEAPTREKALEFALELFVLGDITHVAGKSEFVDGHYFYQFSSATGNEETSMSGMPPVMQYFQAHPLKFDAFALEFKKRAIAMDRKFHGKTYKQSFIGSEAVDLIVESVPYEETINRQDAVMLGQQMMDLDLFKHVTGDHGFADAEYFYKFKDVEQFLINCQKFVTNAKRVGQLRKAQGQEPKYPVIIVPGLASSALEVWETPKSGWHGERVWIDISKIGKAAKVYRVQKAVSKLMQSKSSIKSEDVPEERDMESEKISRVWLRHMVLQEDGFSDPPGIRVRPVEGLHACDYLSTSPLTKKATYVMAHVIRNLMDAGYDKHNLAAAPYDWRLPPCKLEERDGYFSALKCKIDLFRMKSNEKVVLMGHSMGNRTIQYFLCWAKKAFGQEWIDENVQGMLALGAPFLGATKVVRGLISGDQIGLDMFLTLDEAITFSQGLGSMPWLLPLESQLLPAPTLHLRDRGDKKAPYETKEFPAVIKSLREASWNMWEQFYEDDDCFLKKGEGQDLPPVLEIPPVKNLWCVYGINLKTEVSYYYDVHSDGKHHLDSSANALSLKVCEENPAGLRISSGRAYEDSNTAQPKFDVKASGDGTVPYCSLAYCKIWKERAKSLQTGQNIEIFELLKKDHRTMLKDDTVIDKILSCVLTPRPPLSSLLDE